MGHGWRNAKLPCRINCEVSANWRYCFWNSPSFFFCFVFFAFFFYNLVVKHLVTIFLFIFFSLLREAQWHGLEVRPGGLSSEYTSTAISSITSSSDPPLLIVEDELAQDERQLLGRYGVWLLVGLCTPNSESTPTHTLGRLLAMLFHWFHITALSFDGLYHKNSFTGP